MKTFLLLLAFTQLSLAVITRPDALLYYSKLETLTPGDETGRFPNATAVGTTKTAVVTGYDGQALRFNDAVKTDAISIGVLPLAGAATYSVWVNLQTAQTFAKVFSNKPDWNSALGSEMQINGNEIDFIRGMQIVDTIPYVFTLNTWVHIALVATPNAPVAFYVNGTAVAVKGNAKADSKVVANAVNPFTIGGSVSAAGAINANAVFHGIIDEIRVYNASLTAAEVQSIFNETFVVPVETSETSEQSSSATSETSQDEGLTTSSIGDSVGQSSVVLTNTRITTSSASPIVAGFFVLLSALLFFA